MTQRKTAERIASMADKVCLNGHKGDWVARPQSPSGQQGRAYCVSCAKESLARHKEKKASMDTPRIRMGYLPTLASKQQVEERWARSVLNSAPIQVEQLKARLKEITQVVEEAHEVIKKTKDNDLLEFALTKVREMSEAIHKVD